METQLIMRSLGSDGSLSPTLAKFHGRCSILVHPDINQVSRGTKNNNCSCNYPIILIMIYHDDPDMDHTIVDPLNSMLQFGCHSSTAMDPPCHSSTPVSTSRCARSIVIKEASQRTSSAPFLQRQAARHATYVRSSVPVISQPRINKPWFRKIRGVLLQ